MSQATVVLIDEAPGPRTPDAILAALDPEQREVATALGGPVAVIAGAGTGKTRAITHRIAYAVAAGVYRPTAVLAVTFTQRAAGEMRGRLSRLGVRGVQARTFHSAALRQAAYFWPRVHGSDLPGVLENRMSLVAESASRLRVRTDTPALRDLVTEIGWAKVSNVSPEDYPRIAAARGRELASADPETVGRVFAGYEKTKRERDRIDFEDILLCTASLIAEHPRVAEEVRRTYRHLVVDEYQDVSPLQQALLDLWRGDSDDLCVVGDPAQTIHSFAGAQSTFLTGFTKRHPGARVIRLVRDYRSTPQVVKVANQVMARRGGPGGPGTKGPGVLGAVTLQAQRDPGPEPVFAEAADEASEAGAVADWCAARHAEGVEYREMAVLFRVNAQSPAFEQALADRGVPYLVRGAERFYERPEVRQALLLLRNEARQDRGAGGDAADPVGEPSAVDRVKAVLGAAGWSEKPPEGSGAVRERWESLAALVSVAEDLERQQPEGSPLGLAAVSAELDRRAEAQHAPVAQGVTVSTLHSAKGLEWDAVCLVGVQEGSLPFVLATGPEEIEEERRLLYVGVTRARSHLRISWSRTRNGSGQRQPSRFLDGIRPGGSSQPRTRASGERRGRSSALAATCRSCGRALHDAAERKLGRHEDCPATYDEATLDRLKQWRKKQAASQGLPAYCVFTDATLTAIAEARPTGPGDLLRISGLGSAKAAKYGEPVLAILSGQDPEDVAG
ncbi:DNA helicase-2/ATP-dependent DNA helicase PcrA [Friedmanniella endophytica]|uniref:DNA 3'-5' helicase n=1 Tax=Microlunatus kandeliicorticis TaxID=1759536 RepID=A0A7W3P757_9ACTN|nr:ATP-dependent DNA helicase UvrD2 [Microlunatus kandeliicorticis]MBA8795630.1 DNA helicase-2/ATP-dependent DNA helicase PcrA [Microlunatus kandeliicorticis]